MNINFNTPVYMYIVKSPTVLLKRLPEDSPHGRFATEDSFQKIRRTTGETYECEREFERKRRTNVCNRADVEDSPHSGDRLGSGDWVERVGVRGIEVGGLRLGSGGLRLGSGGLGSWG